jgi:predicted DNA-binding WGR domain protein
MRAIHPRPLVALPLVLALALLVPAQLVLLRAWARAALAQAQVLALAGTPPKESRTSNLKTGSSGRSVLTFALWQFCRLRFAVLLVNAQASIEGSELTTRYGRIGNPGATSVKNMGTVSSLPQLRLRLISALSLQFEKAERAVSNLIQQKQRKGYRVVPRP